MMCLISTISGGEVPCDQAIRGGRGGVGWSGLLFGGGGGVSDSENFGTTSLRLASARIGAPGIQMLFRTWVAEKAQQLDLSKDPRGIRDVVKDVVDLLDSHLQRA